MLTSKENLLRAIRHDQPQWVPTAAEGIAWIGPPVVERCLQAGRDDFGVHWSYDPHAEGGTYPTSGGHTITDLARWKEQITIPDVDAMGWDAIAAYAAGIDRDQHLLCAFIELGLFERSYLLLGMSEALMGYVAEPELMNELLEALADYKIRLIERLDDVAQLDMVWYGDDWGTQDRLFVRPEVWRNIVKPHTQRLYTAMKQRGLLINQHSCGKIEAIFEDLVDMGADVWNPCQPCNDLAALKRQYGGQITFSGGIDSQFVLNRPGATPEEVRAEVRRRIDELAAGGGYIAAPSHSVPYDQELLDAMNDEIASYGRRCYTIPA